MRFKISDTVFDEDKLPLLGGGTYGEVYSLGTDAAKVLYESPDVGHSTKLTQLTTLGQSFASLPEQTSRLVALPLDLATEESSNSVVGYSMHQVVDAAPLFDLNFDPNTSLFKESEGAQLSDESAVELCMSLFQGLDALSSVGIVIGDVAPQNILVERATFKPCFIDLDDSCFDDHISGNLGTLGYVDPRLLEADRNEIEGLPFDALSDLFSLAVICFRILFGFDPYALRIRPRPNDADFAAVHRLTSYRLYREGLKPLERLGLELSDDSVFTLIDSRVNAIEAVNGFSGEDGKAVLSFFDAVFVDDTRDSLLDFLPATDPRRPECATKFDLANLREQEILSGWKMDEIFSRLNKRRGSSSQRRVPKINLVDFGSLAYDTDPHVLERYLASRGLSIERMVAE